MKTLKIILITLLLLLNNAIAFSQDAPLSAIKDKYDAAFQKTGQGVAVLMKKNDIIHTTTLGNQSLNQNSVFNIGSTTKIFTAVLILQEVEQGNLKLTDSIGRYLDPIVNVDGGLTIEKLLAHESGLDEVVGRNVQDIFYAMSDSLYMQDLLGQVEKADPKLVGRFDYCNTNYLLLGKIIENVTDQSYFDVLRERIIEPLKLQNTYPYVHRNLSGLARPMHEGKDVTEFLDHRYFTEIAFAAGSVASTLADMERFFTALFETEKLLTKESLDLMLQSGNKTYGLGIFKPEDDGTPYYGHGGNNIGYSFRNGYNVDSRSLFLMFSNERKIPQREALKKDIIAVLNGKEVVAFRAVDLVRFGKYQGKYLLKEADLEMEILVEADKMYLYVPAQDVKSELTQVNDTTLLDTVVGAEISIIEGDDTALAFEQNGFSTTITKVEESSTARQK